jgi:hypothetical protein
MKFSSILGFAVALLLTSIFSFAQEPTYMDAATHPGKGQTYWRAFFSSGGYNVSGTEFEALSTRLEFAYGLQSTLALVADIEFTDLSGNRSSESGLAESTLQAKYRLFKEDFSPLNTWMVSIFAGLTQPGDIGPMADFDLYPRFAVVSTAILDRHGLNGELEWEAHSDDPDHFSANASYLYRLAPDKYAPETPGAWYVMLESLNQFTLETDSRSDLAVGILYEAQRWAFEMSLLLPLQQDWQQENNHQVTIGFRFLP